MSDQFDELFQEIIRDHYKHPTHRAILNPDAPVFENPSCGDQIRLQLVVRAGRVERCRFDGAGCSISQSSADMMCALLEGRPVDEVRSVIEEFLQVMRGEVPPEALRKHGDLEALGGVAQLPVRVKCATLAWNAARKMLDDATSG